MRVNAPRVAQTTARLIFNNSLVLYIYGGVVATEAGVYAVSLDGSTAVSGSDKIVSGATYTVINLYE